MNTTAHTPPTQRSINVPRKQQRPLWLMLGVIILALVLGLIAFVPDGMHYHTQESTHTKGFPVQKAAIAQVPASLQRIHAWADVSENMLGFVELPKGNCIASLYRDMLQNLPALLDGTNAAPIVDWQLFSHAYSEALENGSPTDTSLYIARSKMARSPQGILPALRAVSPGVPTVIFTDLEQSQTSDYLSALQQAAKALFDQGYTVRIDRFISAFGGVISNYAGQGGSFLYGKEQRGQTNLKQVQVWKTGNHHQPRPFFVITIGSALQCETIGNALAASMQRFYTDEHVRDRGSHENLDLALYQTHNVFLLEVPLPLSLATLTLATRTSEPTASITPSALPTVAASGTASAAPSAAPSPQPGVELPTGITSLPLSSAIAKQPQGAQGVQGYVLDRASAGAQATIRFSVSPAVARLGKDYRMLWDPFAATYETVTQTPTRQYDPAQDALFLQARGPRYLKMGLATLPPENQSFSFQASGEPGAASTVDFTIATRNVPTGLYRINLLLKAKPNVAVNRLPYGQNVDTFSATADQALAIITQINKAKEFSTAPLLQTFGLDNLERSIRRAFIESEEGRTVLLGQISFDLRVQ